VAAVAASAAGRAYSEDQDQSGWRKEQQGDIDGTPDPG